jgi:hypothetical protein
VSAPVSARRLLADEERSPGCVEPTAIEHARGEIDAFHALLARMGELVSPTD